MNNCCLYCKHFTVWDGDPCCLHKDGWKIILPSEVCENISHADDMYIENNKYRWMIYKDEFFNRYTISDTKIREKYLSMFPDDIKLIDA